MGYVGEAAFCRETAQISRSETQKCTKRRQKQGEQYLKQLNKEGLAIQRNAHIQQSLQKQKEKAEAKEYDRQKRQKDAAKKAQDDELKALSDYAKRYMELQESKIKADKKASDERKRQSEAERKRIETDTERTFPPAPCSTVGEG